MSKSASNCLLTTSSLSAGHLAGHKLGLSAGLFQDDERGAKLKETKRNETNRIETGSLHGQNLVQGSSLKLATILAVILDNKY